MDSEDRNLKEHYDARLLRYFPADEAADNRCNENLHLQIQRYPLLYPRVKIQIVFLTIQRKRSLVVIPE